MAKKILNPKYGGIKGWEYGMLLDCCRFTKGAHVLDVGTGGSLIPYYLASKKGVQVTTFDRQAPSEKPKFSLSHPGISHATGTMLRLPFPNATFDGALCVSAIEHLDHGTYAKFLRDTKIAISEMVRVTKPKGYIFLTSDMYFPHLQKTDRWDGATKERIGTAYKRGDFERVFVESFTQLNCRLMGGVDFNFDTVTRDFGRNTYRGRYFTTFTLYAEKN